MNKIKMPVGVEFFKTIRNNSCYYVDKTKIISEILEKSFAVYLITRPRRFGKTLTMNMLEEFFDINNDSVDLFEGLYISSDKKICSEWQNKWPVISLTLKDIDAGDFKNAYEKLETSISELYLEHSYLKYSDKVDEGDVELFNRIRDKKATMTELQNAIFSLMRMINAYYNQQVIVLIDEYDVPLAIANEKGYYHEMLDVIRGLMGKTLKTNKYLKFAIITGCLRIAKESIFTGINNFVTDTISDERFSEYIGFTENDVQKMIMDAGLESYAAKIKDWYNGYCFGNMDIYCPWDVINYINDIQDCDAKLEPKNYWENTSHNGIIRTFIDMANNGMRPEWNVNDEFESLLMGEYIEKSIDENINYDTLYSSEDNLWSVLYLTGYLTKVRDINHQDGKVALRIPNEEVKDIFRKTIVSWFNDYVTTIDKTELFEALWNGDEAKATEIMSDLLFETISYNDYKEDFYHAFMVGVFAGGGYIVKSNTEQGLGRPDIMIIDRRNRKAMVIEVKRALDEDSLDKECQKAIAQIVNKRYADEVKKRYKTVVIYGVAFFEKECLVKNHKTY